MSHVIDYKHPLSVKPSELPTSVMQLTDLKWRNKVGWVPTNGSLFFQFFCDCNAAIRGRPKTLEWLEAQ